ncbi:MAG: FHA domain-containing protein [Proteobacteria bacterium]|nr:FHA domain-containing protein [Pseudomonadota bacterium]
MKPVFELTLHYAGTSRSFHAEEGAMIAGSDPSCEVVIDSTEVAPHHTSIWLEGTKIQVEDLTGAHGTLVNGYDISGRVEIECPASVQVGPATLTIRITTNELAAGDDPAALSPAEPSLADDAPSLEPSAHDGVPPGPRSASVQVQYALGPEIARGGMGRIYKGQDPQLKREVAIKVSSSGGGRDPRFAREAEVLGNLPHPNIVPIHAMGEDDDGFPFYSMKLVKGQTLQAIIKSLREGDLETKRTFSRERLL